MRVSDADTLKIESAVNSILLNTLSAKKTVCFVHTAEFFDSLKASSLRRSQFEQEVSDHLCGNAVCAQFGTWIFTEFGDGFSTFVQLSPKRETVDTILTNDNIYVAFDGASTRTMAARAFAQPKSDNAPRIAFEILEELVDNAGFKLVSEPHPFGRNRAELLSIKGELNNFHTLSIKPVTSNIVCFYGCPKGFLGNPKEQWGVVGAKRVKLENLAKILKRLTEKQ